VISELIKLRHRAIDLDTDEWSQLARMILPMLTERSQPSCAANFSYAQLSSHCCVAPPA
jgi:hypothetical protein